MTTKDGIIDEVRNPFTRTSWVKQGRKLTGGRASELNEILGFSVKKIKGMDDDNVTNYPAFVGIRWGYAEIVNDKLLPTKKREIEKDELLKAKNRNTPITRKPKSHKKKYSAKPSELGLVSRICGGIQVPATCQVYDITRFVDI